VAINKSQTGGKKKKKKVKKAKKSGEQVSQLSETVLEAENQ